MKTSLFKILITLMTVFSLAACSDDSDSNSSKKTYHWDQYSQMCYYNKDGRRWEVEASKCGSQYVDNYCDPYRYDCDNYNNNYGYSYAIYMGSCLQYNPNNYQGYQVVDPYHCRHLSSGGFYAGGGFSMGGVVTTGGYYPMDGRTAVGAGIGAILGAIVANEL